MLTVSEISNGGAALSNLKLAPGDQVQISLAGTNVINGLVVLRQAVYDDKTHAVQIGIASRAEIVTRTTVDAKPGQYINQTIQQIGSACFGAVGIGFSVIGPVGEAFKRIQEPVGSSRWSFIENLCRLRNLHLMDNGQGTIEAYRGTQGSSAPLQEGVNILRARLLLSIIETAVDINGVSMLPNPDSGAGGAQVSAQATATPPFPASGNFKFPVENAATKGDVQQRVNHQVDHIQATTVDGTITVQGWFDQNGKLWIEQVRNQITVNSPMLITQ
jgi:prophage tail gpP-like protein